MDAASLTETVARAKHPCRSALQSKCRLLSYLFKNKSSPQQDNCCCSEVANLPATISRTVKEPTVLRALSETASEQSWEQVPFFG